MKNNLFFVKSLIINLNYYTFKSMNFELEKAWKSLLDSFHLDNIERPDVDSILFVIGLQELNFKTGKLSKDQKLDVIHIGLCVVFIPYGYYEVVGRDKEGWIHFKSIKNPQFKCRGSRNHDKRSYYRLL